MKNLLILLAFVFAVSISVPAQDKKEVKKEVKKTVVTTEKKDSKKDQSKKTEGCEEESTGSCCPTDKKK